MQKFRQNFIAFSIIIFPDLLLFNRIYWEQQVACIIRIKYLFHTRIHCTTAFFIVSTRYALVDRKTSTARIKKLNIINKKKKEKIKFVFGETFRITMNEFPRSESPKASKKKEKSKKKKKEKKHKKTEASSSDSDSSEASDDSR